MTLAIPLVQVRIVMRHVGVQEAKTHLSRLLRRVVLGEDVVITRSGQPVARLVAVEDGRPILGVDEGRFGVPDDFDEPLDVAGSPLSAGRGTETLANIVRVLECERRRVHRSAVQTAMVGRP